MDEKRLGIDELFINSFRRTLDSIDQVNALHSELSHN